MKILFSFKVLKVKKVETKLIQQCSKCGPITFFITDFVIRFAAWGKIKLFLKINENLV